MNNVLISVIVPIYNVEKYLERCIESILKQTYNRLEIVLVNDGSLDGGLKICREYEKKDNRIIVIDKENEGLLSARRTGLAVATGEYVTFVDSDDWIEPIMYEKLIEKSCGGSADIITSGAIFDYPHSTSYSYDKVSAGIYDEDLLDKVIYPQMLFSGQWFETGIIPSVWSKLFRRDILESIYPEISDKITVGEDVVVTYPALLLAEKVVITKECYYHYCIRYDSITYSADIKRCESTYYLHQCLQKFFAKYKYAEILLKQLKYFMFNIELKNLKILYNVEVLNIGRYQFQIENIKDRRIILYGAGKIGRKCYDQLIEEGAHIVAWVDTNYRNIINNGINVESPKVIEIKEYDYIIISVSSEIIVEEIRNGLINMGIGGEKIKIQKYILSINLD